MGVSGESIIQLNCSGGVGQGAGDWGCHFSPLPALCGGRTDSSLSPKRGDGLEDAACRMGTHSWPVLHKDVLGFCTPGTAPGEGGVSGQQT